MTYKSTAIRSTLRRRLGLSVVFTLIAGLFVVYSAPVTDSATPADSTATVKPEKMETDQTSAPPTTNGEVTSDPTSTGAQNEEAMKEARKTAKRIINDTAKLDPNRIPQDTGRSRRKVCVSGLSLYLSSKQ